MYTRNAKGKIRVFVFCFSMLTILSGTYLFAKGPAIKKIQIPPMRVLSVDDDTRIDVNNLDMFVTNHGMLANDIINGGPGLFFPKGSTKNTAYMAGLSVGAMVNGELHVAVSIYGDEFGPGTIENGVPSNPQNPRFRVYKITTGDGPGTPDWDEWPIEDGAPVDEFGNPKIFGDQTLWAVFNDAHTSLHTNSIGSTNPLGIEVQLTVFAYRWPNTQANTIYVKYKIINKSSNSLDDTYLHFWSDPDLGDHMNDYSGYDAGLGLGYCYNSEHMDNLYQAVQPVIGKLLIQGPIGDGGERLEITSYHTLDSGTNEPSNATELYNVMQGLNADGSQIIDPTTGMPTTYMHTGNPVTGTGWIDDYDADKRTALNTGPFTMAPDDTQEVIFAFVTGMGEDRLNSLEELRAMVAEVRDMYNQGFPDPDPPTADAAAVIIHQPPNVFELTEQFPSGTVAHLGSDTLSFDILYKISLGGTTVYQSSRTTSLLSPGETDLVEFDGWTPSNPDTYDVELIVTLSGDADNTNDTLRTQIEVTGPPGPVDLQLFSRTTNAAEIGWQPPPDVQNIAGYNVYRSSTSGGPYTQLNGALILDLSYTDNTIPTEVVYYVVTLEQTSGLESHYSDEFPVYPVMNVSTENILLVNGVHWDYGQEIMDFYTKQLAGRLDYDFWDLFTNNPVGFTPIGEGQAPPWDLFEDYKTVIWIGNNWGGDLGYWQESLPALKQYLLFGGNLILGARNASVFFDNVLATSYARIDYWSDYVTIGENNPLVSLVPELMDMGPANGAIESTHANMFMELTEPLPDNITTFTSIFNWDDLGGTIWRGGFRSELTGGGQFVFFSGRPYRFDEAASQANYDSVLVKWFGHPAPPPPLFIKITEGDIVNDDSKSNGCAWGDYNNDGNTDLFVANDAGTNFLYSNNGDGSFSKISTDIIVTDVGNSLSGTWGDYNNDGYLDLFVANGYPDPENNFLYTNNGDGSFTKVTSDDIVSDGGSSFACSWGDYDNDGDLELFVANRNDENNFLYANNGDGTFTKITAGEIVNDGGASFGCGWGDYDNDGDVDLFVANRYGQNNFLYANNGDGSFTKITSGAIVTDGGESDGSSWGDYDNDGDLDLFVTNKNEDNFLYQNNGDGSFTKITEGPVVTDGGASFGSGWGDYDNDGDLDLFVANQNQNNFLYSNNGDGTFTKITSDIVVLDGGNSSGCCWSDYDKDGDIDLFVANWDYENNFLYSNNGNSNNWINIKCVGTVSNKSAIGAQVRVKAVISGNSVWQLREISAQTGNGNGSQNSLNAEFGLGDATIIDSIKIKWPSGIVQVLTSINVNQFLTITESSERYEITGNIGYYSNDDPVDSAVVKANSVYLDTTDLNGDYELLDLPPDNYIVRPEKDNDTGSSISAFDAAWILQYGVGLRTFTPYQMIAGDVSGNGSVSAFDAAKILQYGVGLINQFPVMSDTAHFWRFVPEDFAITPSNWTTAPDSIAYTPLNNDTTDNYYGIIYGDVSGNWQPSAAGFASLRKSSGERVDIKLADISGERGNKVVLSVVLDNGSDILAISFTLEYDAKILKALSASTTGLTESWQIAHNINQGQIRVALAGIKPIAISGAMVNLEFEVLGTELSETSSPLNISEIKINEDNISVNIQSAKFTMGSPLPKEYALSQNYPNPFNAQTAIKYQLPKAGRVVLKIYNTMGQEVRTLVDEQQQAGYHGIHWDGLNAEGSRVSSGIYIYRIQAGDFVEARKMLFIM